MFGELGAHLLHPHQLLLLELLKAEYSSCDYTDKDKHEEYTHW